MRGQSIWDWQAAGLHLDPRYTDYARANASIGINGTVLNNVNAKADSADRALYRQGGGPGRRVPALWDQGLSVGPVLGPDRDRRAEDRRPADPAVRAWWKAKADEIYKAIPDFGGFLVKANSEGQPGPQDYGRTHADGANMLADAVGPHGGS
jgi:alpha-glucuronidase